MPWMSIRNEWPPEPGKYKVFDCRFETQTKAKYDGFEFTCPNIYYGEMENSYPKKFTITHWKEAKDQKIEAIRRSVEKHRLDIDTM